MVKTEKTALFRHLESKVESYIPSSASVDACVVDGSFLLWVLPPNLPATYGKLAATIIIQATALSSKRVDIVFDTYEEPSIKGTESERRGTCDRNYKIIGPQQPRPADFNEALRSTSFKRELPTFLLNEWKEQAYANIIHERHVYVGHLDECRHFYVEDGVVRHETIDVLGCNDAEADTRICLHARGIDDVGNANNIIIRTSDTDIAVIMIHHAWKLLATLWMDTGTSNGKNRRYVDLSAIAISISSNVCQALLAYHAFTGTDYTSAIIRKGKVRQFRRLESSNDAQYALIAITSGKVDASSERALLKFGATLFGAKAAESSSLNGFRYTAFEKAFGPSANAKNPLNKLNDVDASSLPPCEAELRQPIHRFACVVNMWADADHQTIDQHPATEDVWELITDQYEIIWCNGIQLPDTLVPERVDAQCEDDDSAVVLSSDDEHGELSSENDDDDAGDDY